MTVHRVMEFEAKSGDRLGEAIAFIKDGFAAAAGAGADPAGFRLVQRISADSHGEALTLVASIAHPDRKHWAEVQDRFGTDPGVQAWIGKLIDPSAPCRMGARNLVPGAREVARSISKRLFAKSLAELVPAITADDLEPATAGVRAQAMRRDGTLVDDFLIQTAPRQIHVLNAPSPAATCALEIARHIVDRLDATAA